MSTQLRLVEPPETTTSKAVAASTGAGRRPAREPVRRPARTARRRAVRWGDWHLDTRTRHVGRAGVAAARAALERVAAEQARDRAAREGDGGRLAS